MTTWRIELAVREDAERMFVPAELLPDARAGDRVVATSHDPATTRAGRVVDRADDASRGRYVVVAFEAPGDAGTPRADG
jgi:hypothetical protein